MPTLTCLGKPLDLSPSAFGQLRRSDEIAHDGSALRQRMREEGYLYLPGLLDPAEVLGVRRQVTDRLAELGLLHERQPRLDASYRPGGGALKSSHDLARNNPLLEHLLYSGAMMDYYARFLGGLCAISTSPGSGRWGRDTAPTRIAILCTWDAEHLICTPYAIKTNKLDADRIGGRKPVVAGNGGRLAPGRL